VILKIFKWPHPIFVIIHPLGRTWPKIWKKSEFPLPKDILYQVWLTLACWFWRRRLLRIFSVFLLFRDFLPLEKGIALHMSNSESPLPKNDLCQLWLQLARRFWRSWICKSLTDRHQTPDIRRMTDNRGSEKLTWAFSSGELKTYVTSDLHQQ
jgi:hypothetical protein